MYVMRHFVSKYLHDCYHGGVPHAAAPVVHAESQAHAGQQGGDPGERGEFYKSDNVFFDPAL